MNPSPECPICNAADWEEIGSRKYAANGMSTATEYVRQRLRVLFEIWLPEQTEVTLRSLLCRDCGFVTYAPRPTAKDIDDKYRFLTSQGSNSTDPSADAVTERARALRLWKKFRKRLKKTPSRILDFGGGDGRLMAPFVEHGHDCFLVDYNLHAVQGVERLGSTLADVSSDVTFDAIVCSHVIEHVAEPYTVLVELMQRLNEGGVIYVEVPMEIWRKAPLHVEPVTHVNFFTVESLKILLARVGFFDLDIRMECYLHPAGHRAIIVGAFGQRVESNRQVVSMCVAADATRGLINPSFSRRVQRAMLNPKTIPAAMLNRLRRSKT